MTSPAGDLCLLRFDVSCNRLYQKFTLLRVTNACFLSATFCGVDFLTLLIVRVISLIFQVELLLHFCLIIAIIHNLAFAYELSGVSGFGG